MSDNVATSMTRTSETDRHDLRPLFAPRSIAVVGASDKPGAGSIVLDNLRQLGYQGAVYPVNPKYATLGGWRCYRSLSDIPGSVDSVAILVGHQRVMPVLEEMAALGIKAGWSLASGFSESGPAGAALQRNLVAFCRQHAIRLLGPNCIGMVNPTARAATYSVAVPETLSAGHVGAVVQSGAVCLGLANANRGLGFSLLISSGNEAVLDNADYISYLVDDPQTRVIIAFIEGFKDPSNFVQAARRAREAGKPLLVVKVGRSEVARRATLAHTGSLAGSNAVHDAVFRKHGVIRLDSLDELLEAAELFLKAPMPRGRGVALLTLSGGQIGLIGDLLQGIDLDLAELSEAGKAALAQILPPYGGISNPLDAWGSGNFEETYPACMEVLGREPDVHLIGVARDSSPGIAAREIMQSNVIVDAAARVADESGKPVLVFSNIANGITPAVKTRADQLGLPFLQGTRASLRVMSALIQYAESVRVPPAPDSRFPVSTGAIAAIRADLASQPMGVTEAVGKRLLAAYGVPVTRERLATSSDEAVVAARELGCPVALKIQSPNILHKTEAQGVLLGLSDPDRIRIGYETIIRNALRYKPDASIDGVLVQEMIQRDAVEVIVGMSVDPEFGPVIVFGSGGVLVELFQDTTLRLAPVTPTEAYDMIASVRAARLLRGFRGRPVADIDALAEAIVRISHLAADFSSEIATVDVNPLMVLPVGAGVVAADALVIKA